MRELIQIIRSKISMKASFWCLMLDAWWKPEILPTNFVTMCGDHFCRVWNCKNFRHSHFPSNIIHKVHHMWTMSKDEICEIWKCSGFIYPIWIHKNLSQWINCLNIGPCWQFFHYSCNSRTQEIFLASNSLSK